LRREHDFGGLPDADLVVEHGAAQIVESRFGHGSVVVKFQYQDRRRCDHQIACSNIASGAKKKDRDSDILFLVLTSHGSPDGLAIMAGRRAETLKPSTLADARPNGRAT
jgi:hypothetical protein